VWCVVTILETQYYRSLPVPSSAARAGRATLPGEGPASTYRGASKLPVGTWIARLEAPSVELTATVLEGSDDGTLNRAAGHIEDTALFGERGNVGIAAHRDTIFRPVRICDSAIADRDHRRSRVSLSRCTGASRRAGRRRRARREGSFDADARDLLSLHVHRPRAEALHRVCGSCGRRGAEAGAAGKAGRAGH
jgi:hypothetical protein